MGDLNSVVIEHQHQDQWCWAAVTQSVCQYFGNITTQEDIVSQTVNNPGCATAPDSCDFPFPIQFALQTMGRFDNQDGVLSFTNIQQQIDNLAHPVAITIAFNGPLGPTNHYCLIKGYSVVGGIPHVTVLDPAPENGAESHVSYDDLCSGLTMGGPWTESFTVK
jgi:Peptidase_C39 like family